MPDWMPWVLAGASFVSTLLILILGLFLKGIKVDVAKNTDLTIGTLNTVHNVKTDLTATIHRLETTVLREYTPIGAHNEVRASLHKLRDQVAPMQAHFDLSKLREAKRG